MCSLGPNTSSLDNSSLKLNFSDLVILWPHALFRAKHGALYCYVLRSTPNNFVTTWIDVFLSGQWCCACSINHLLAIPIAYNMQQWPESHSTHWQRKHRNSDISDQLSPSFCIVHSGQSTPYRRRHGASEFDCCQGKLTIRYWIYWICLLDELIHHTPAQNIFSEVMFVCICCCKIIDQKC